MSKELKKVIIDRLNHKKSELTQLRNKKMDKSIDELKITIIEAEIKELDWMLNKINLL